MNMTAPVKMGILLLCILGSGDAAYASKIDFSSYVQIHMTQLRTTDEQLQSIYHGQLRERYDNLICDILDPNWREECYERREAFFSTPRDARETAYVLEALKKACASEPKDWATIATALEIAVVGTNDENTVQLCADILNGARDIPDNGSDVIWSASQYLLVKRGLEYVDLVASCVYADYIGVQDETNQWRLTNEKEDRNFFRFEAVRILATYLHGEDCLRVFTKLEQDHPRDKAVQMGSWQRRIADLIWHEKRASEYFLSEEYEQSLREQGIE